MGASQSSLAALPSFSSKEPTAKSASIRTCTALESAPTAAAATTSAVAAVAEPLATEALPASAGPAAASSTGCDRASRQRHRSDRDAQGGDDHGAIRG